MVPESRPAPTAEVLISIILVFLLIVDRYYHYNLLFTDDYPAGVRRSRLSTGVNIWHNQFTRQPLPQVLENPHPITAPFSSCISRPTTVSLFDSAIADATAGGFSEGSLGCNGGAGWFVNSVAQSSSAPCKDCGNQAKKDCIHQRCRTCCKSRGFDCATHVRSSWVPAARRRERQISGAANPVEGGGDGGAGTKKPRLFPSDVQASNASAAPTHWRVRENLTGQLRAPAVFKCLRMTSVEDGEDELAYQAEVRIGGHVFKGFLYDQGVEEADVMNTGHDAALRAIRSGHGDHAGNVHNHGSMPSLSEIHLGPAGAVGNGGRPPDMYSALGPGGGQR
ncbi:unnamed protein product [Spirodela intermedia]|uniref:Uncharacterized protein n=1 Tax=Spirodela intermedia TaxID=51605 RepID=A0A7I8J081_SPIIN|nr:unnamed protein product [Spirodela intermedia]CAA6663537.1 unnamed protein product [Spirodela intermedia]